MKEIHWNFSFGIQEFTAFNLVEMIGLEPTTSALQRRRSPKLSYIPNDFKRPGLRVYGARATVSASTAGKSGPEKNGGLS